MWAEGLARLPAAEVGMYLYLEPLAAVVIAWLLLGETVTIWLLVGAALITLGLWVTQRSGRVRPPHILPQEMSGET
jgi:drug/metabolite transporter (DMT)-like permease